MSAAFAAPTLDYVVYSYASCGYRSPYFCNSARRSARKKFVDLDADAYCGTP